MFLHVTTGVDAPFTSGVTDGGDGLGHLRDKRISVDMQSVAMKAPNGRPDLTSLTRSPAVL